MPTDYVVVEFRPMRAWPGAATPSGARASNRAFKVTSGATLAELEQELQYQNCVCPPHHRSRA